MENPHLYIIGNTSSKGPFSIAMLVYRSVSIQKLNHFFHGKKNDPAYSPHFVWTISEPPTPSQKKRTDTNRPPKKKKHDHQKCQVPKIEVLTYISCMDTAYGYGNPHPQNSVLGIPPNLGTKSTFADTKKRTKQKTQGTRHLDPGRFT